MLQNRESAGDRLASLLEGYHRHPSRLVLALPRGGVPVGYRISVALEAPLDVFITRKLGAPGNPELAVGALAETGATYFNQEIITSLGVSNRQLQSEVRAQQQEIVRRQKLYRGARPLPTIAGRTVIVVDDGIATGATFFASVAAIRSLHPARLAAAIPVGPQETVEKLRRQVDELFVLEIPTFFSAVGNHYEDFQQVDDQTVIHYLSLGARPTAGDARALTPDLDGSRVEG